MSPLKHYSGPLLPEAPKSVFDQVIDDITDIVAAHHEQPQAAQAVDNPKEPTPEEPATEPEPQQYHISTYLTAFPNGTFGVHMHSDSFTAEGNGDHPEEAVLLAMHKLWTQMDRPRCPHCGQVMPEEAGK